MEGVRIMLAAAAAHGPELCQPPDGDDEMTDEVRSLRYGLAWSQAQYHYQRPWRHTQTLRTHTLLWWYRHNKLPWLPSGLSHSMPNRSFDPDYVQRKQNGSLLALMLSSTRQTFFFNYCHSLSRWGTATESAWVVPDGQVLKCPEILIPNVGRRSVWATSQLLMWSDHCPPPRPLQRQLTQRNGKVILAKAQRKKKCPKQSNQNSKTNQKNKPRPLICALPTLAKSFFL